jgi:hypothetical protein
MNREAAVRERRMLKQAKKDARKLAAANPPEEVVETPAGDGDGDGERVDDAHAA